MKPLIVRVVMADDWPAAWMLVSQEAYDRSAVRHGHEVDPTPWRPKRAVAMDWKNARAGALLCASAAADDGDEELAAAYFALGADPSGPGFRKTEGWKTYTAVLREISRVIVADPTLLDDEQFCEAVEGWRFLEMAGSDGEDDLILSARDYGRFGKIDKAAMLARAKMWSETTS